MRRERRRWWTWLVTVAAVLVVLAATLSVSFKLAIDALPGYRTELEGLVAKSVGHPARIGSMTLRWRHFQPTLELREVALLDAASGAPLLEAARLNLGVGFWRLLGGHLSLSRIEAAGIALDADVDAEGRWSLRGFAPPSADSGASPSLLADLKRFESVRVLDSEVLVHDARLAANPTAAMLPFRLRSADIRHHGEHYSLAATLEPPAELARRVDLSAVVDGDPALAGSLHGAWRLAVDRIEGWPWLGDALLPGVQLAFERSALKLDGKLEKGRVSEVVLDLQIGSVIARLAGEVKAQTTGLQLHAKAAALPDDAWRIDVDQLVLGSPRNTWKAGAISLSGNPAAEASRYRLEAAQVRLDAFAPWLGLSRALPPSAQRLRDLQGNLEALELSLSTSPEQAAPLIEFKTRLHQVALAGEADQSGFSGLQGQLEGNLDQGRFLLDGSPLRLQLPEHFEQPVPIESLRGELDWQRIGDAWQLTAPALDLRMLGTQAEGDGALRLTREAAALPFLKLHLRLRSTDAAVLKPLMPKTWGPSTRAWLTRALMHARVSEGELRLEAPMTPRTADGRMTIPWRLDLNVTDGELDYAPGWPAVTGLSAQLHFHDAGVEVEADAGEVIGNRIENLKATIADFQNADLVLGGSLAGDGADFYRLLRNSPLQTRLGGLLRITEASGPVSADVQLRVPLHMPEPQVQASGEVRFDKTQLAIRGVEQPVRELDGRLAFGASGVSAEALSARFYGSAITARIHPEAGAADGVLIGELAFSPAAAGGPEEAFVPPWLRSGLSGQSQMQLRLPFSGPGSGQLVLSSDLRGVSSSLPPPLAKLADDSLALRVVLGGDANVPLRLQVEAGDALRAGLRFAEVDGVMKTRAAELRIGAGEMPHAEADGFVITGAPAVLDLASWAALLGAAQAGGSALAFTRADLRPERLVYRSYALGPTHLLATPAANQAIHINLEGAAAGQIDWLPEDGGRIVARLQQAAFAALPPLPAAPAEAVKASPFNPAAAPIIDLDCAALSLGDVAFGHLMVATARVPDGQRIERLRLAGGKLIVDAQGSWLRRGDNTSEPDSSADLSFEIASDKIAEVLKVFGYAPNLRAEEAQFSGRLNWPRAPEGLELAQAEGSIKLDVKRGSLKAVDPGAGRVLGLINLYALPRRLLFDFRDVVSDGLAFDTLKGSFKLAGGDADTDDLQIIGPQAKVKLDGRIGLAARDYDQRVTVTPDISTGVTLGATLLGGPIGGGIALVGQQLFGKPFNRLARFSYRVTGSWANPELSPEAAKAVDPALPPPVPKPNEVGEQTHG